MMGGPGRVVLALRVMRYCCPASQRTRSSPAPAMLPCSIAPSCPPCWLIAHPIHARPPHPLPLQLTTCSRPSAKARSATPTGAVSLLVRQLVRACALHRAWAPALDCCAALEQFRSRVAPRWRSRPQVAWLCAPVAPLLRLCTPRQSCLTPLTLFCCPPAILPPQRTRRRRAERAVCSSTKTKCLPALPPPPLVLATSRRCAALSGVLE